MLLPHMELKGFEVEFVRAHDQFVLFLSAKVELADISNKKTRKLAGILQKSVYL
jgi:hypothetical protein